MRSYREAQTRIPTQIDKIINKLREAGEEGVTNSELNEICLRYGARIGELAKKGYLIEVEQVKKGLYKYVLKRVPSEVTYFPSAEEVTMFTIDQEFNGMVTIDQLKHLLEVNHFHIKRKPNWFKRKNEKMKIN